MSTPAHPDCGECKNGTQHISGPVPTAVLALIYLSQAVKGEPRKGSHTDRPGACFQGKTQAEGTIKRSEEKARLGASILPEERLGFVEWGSLSRSGGVWNRERKQIPSTPWSGKGCKGRKGSGRREIEPGGGGKGVEGSFYIVPSHDKQMGRGRGAQKGTKMKGSGGPGMEEGKREYKGE